MPAFRYNDHQVLHFVSAIKNIEGGRLKFQNFDNASNESKELRVSLISNEIGAVTLELKIHTAFFKDPTKYHAALLADSVRIRGVDFDPLGKFGMGYKNKIPKGWHQNIEYPGHPKDRIHAPLDLGVVTHLTAYKPYAIVPASMQIEKRQRWMRPLQMTLFRHRLTMRCSEPCGSVVVVIGASRAQGR